MAVLQESVDRAGDRQLFSAWPALSPPVKVRLVTVPEHPCPYLAGRKEQTRALLAERLPGALYHRFMDAGFRRSGEVLYQPVCRGCRQCISIRVPVARFRPSKSQRRCWRRNTDLSVSVGPARATDEKFEVYRRYLLERHGREEPERRSFEQFLYESPVETLEFSYREGSGRLVAVGICDVSPQSLSSVYFYFDPAESRRRPGVFGALAELQWARESGIPHYYLGYWVRDCGAMAYKADYRPCEVLCGDGVWRELSGE
jgi:arginine-tRNA-protein transferase